MKTPSNILNSVFGYAEFRPLQENIINSALDGHDTVAVLPTGAGKSLCYQIPALCIDGLTVVVSPLISLMQDQIAHLESKGIKSATLNSSQPGYLRKFNAKMVRTGNAKLLYLSPEALITKGMLRFLRRYNVKLVAIDEAHCISSWAPDFRPVYRKICRHRSEFPRATFVALTATATPKVRADIKRYLWLRNPKEFIGGFDRPNLLLQIAKKSANPVDQVLKFVRNKRKRGDSYQSGIIYCFSRSQVDTLTEFLRTHGIFAAPYHAGLSPQEREKNQKGFLRGNYEAIVATIAFGMGIDKPDVRYVIHYDMPQNLESYYQEIGRAGRDGGPAHCLLLFSPDDIEKVKYFIRQKSPLEERIATVNLLSFLRYIKTDRCRRTSLLRYFGEEYNADNCKNCDNCTGRSPGAIDIHAEAVPDVDIENYRLLIRNRKIIAEKNGIPERAVWTDQQVLKMAERKHAKNSETVHHDRNSDGDQ